MPQQESPHRKLNAWKEGMNLVEAIYSMTALLPSEEKFGLISQMRRAAVSVPSNLAEGAGRRTKAEFRHFLTIALGSLSELDTQTELVKRLNFIGEQEYEQIIQQIDSCKALIYGLRRSLGE